MRSAAAKSRAARAASGGAIRASVAGSSRTAAPVELIIERRLEAPAVLLECARRAGLCARGGSIGAAQRRVQPSQGRVGLLELHRAVVDRTAIVAPAQTGTDTMTV